MLSYLAYLSTDFLATFVFYDIVMLLYAGCVLKALNVKIDEHIQVSYEPSL